MLPDALHSLRSLLCTATNETPHERIFKYYRKATYGSTLPIWLVNSDKVYVKRHNRSSKYDQQMEEVDLLECNPNYARIRFADGREDTVSTRHLSPPAEHSDSPHYNEPIHEQSPIAIKEDILPPITDCSGSNIQNTESDESMQPSRSTSQPSLMELQQRTRPYHLRNREV